MSLFQEILAAIPTNANLAEKVKALEIENSNLNQKVSDCERRYEESQTAYHQLAALHVEEKRFHRGIDFRKGRRTGMVWMPFCPKCGLPVNDATMPAGNSRWALCSQHCGWVGVELDLQCGMDLLISEIEKTNV